LAIAEHFLNQVCKLMMVDITGRGDYQVSRREIFRVKIDCLGLIERRNRHHSPFDWPAQRMIGKISGVEEFGKQLVRRVFDHLHFFDDHLLFLNQIAGLKTRV
jgi:hypothetical protein